MLKLHNTESRQLEEIALDPGKTLTIYTCGPTVYDFAHIGNFRTYVFEDILRRTLKYFGFPLKQVQNLTDVEDKTIKGALSKGLSLEAYTAIYKRAFFEDLKALYIEPVEVYPEATKHIPEMIALIKSLLEKNFAYKTPDGSIFFRIHAFHLYGRLSHFKLEDLKEGASTRTAEDEYEKETASDFVLWKSYQKERDGDIFWDSPFGPGRPGWHIECSAMAMKYLGKTIDLHVGGVDNMFPHHENEIAQSEACTGLLFVRHWLHSEHLLVDGKKMSKRLGNFYTLRDLLAKGYTGREVRYMLMQTHYRKQLNFTFQGLEAAKSSLKRLDDFILRLQDIQGKTSKWSIQQLLKKAKQTFTDAMANDLGISEAFAALFDLVREINHLCDENKVGENEAQEVLTLLRDFDGILAVLFTKETYEIPQDILDAFHAREMARKNKDFPKADELRTFIEKRGFVIEDTKTESKIKKQ